MSGWKRFGKKDIEYMAIPDFRLKVIVAGIRGISVTVRPAGECCYYHRSGPGREKQS
jgi:hypothetical protein